jgi:hypothetical protein
VVALVVLGLRRRPPSPPIGPKTLDLGPEPPAVVNFLTHGFRVTADALPATLLDLAARGIVTLEHRCPDLFVCRLREVPSDLSPYEERVVSLLRRRLVDGTVPPEALTTGPEQESAGWRKAFDADVVADAQRRGLSRPLANGKLVALLLVGSLGAGILWWLALPHGGVLAIVWVVASLFLLVFVVSRRTQRETPAGLEAAGRWLGVRAALREDEVFPTLPPITVGIWKRYLAYGAALGCAPGAVRPIPMGAESDTHAWSSYSGHWCAVRVEYPTAFPLGWGRSLGALLGAAAVGLINGFLIFVLAHQVSDAAFLVPLYAPPLLGTVAAAIVLWRSAADLFAEPVTMRGEILRLRVYGDKNKHWFAAVDDGTSAHVRAFVVDPSLYRRLEQGEVVDATVTPHLRHVEAVVPASGA